MAENFFAEEDAKHAASKPPADDVYGGLPPAGFTPPKPKPVPNFHGALLPISSDSSGNFYFDPFGAGPIGAMRKAFTLPGRVMSGETPMPRTFDPAAQDPAVPGIIGETMNLAGTFGAGINPMIRSGDRVIPGVKMAPKNESLAKTPTSEELLRTGGAQIESFKNMPIRYNPAYMATLASRMEQRLVEEGVFPEDAKGLYQTIARLRDYVPRSTDPSATIEVGPANLISIRKNIANKFGAQGENQHGVAVAHNLFNDFLENPPAEAVLAGASAATGLENSIGATLGADIYQRGRGNYAAGMRDAELEAIQREAGLRSRSANSGQNLDNTIRSRITNAVLNAKRLKGFTPAEEAMLEGVPEGSVTNNILRGAGNVLGGGGGLGATVAGTVAGAGSAALGLGNVGASLAAVGVPAIGLALKKAAGKSTSEALGEVQTATRQRSPLFQESPRVQERNPLIGQPYEELGLTPDGVPGRDAMARTLMRMEASPNGLPVSPEPPPDIPPGPRRIMIYPSQFEEKT